LASGSSRSGASGGFGASATPEGSGSAFRSANGGDGRLDPGSSEVTAAALETSSAARAEAVPESLVAGPEAQATFELPLVNLPSAHPCHGCGECCRYVAVEIDKPAAFRDYDHIFWYLTHRQVTVYVDWEGGWFLEFETICEHLTPGRTCGIYEERPRICSSFSWEECERNTQERAWKHRFRDPDEFFTWLREQRPRSYERYAKQRRRMLVERTRTRKRRQVIQRVV
jgi:Fe-S-cluster containining protein